MPTPPSWAMQMAVLDSVTVSIGRTDNGDISKGYAWFRKGRRFNISWPGWPILAGYEQQVVKSQGFFLHDLSNMFCLPITVSP